MKYKNYTPLIFAELYLIITLMMLFFGPIEYNIHNKALFFFYIVLYHLAMILGYCIAIRLKISVKQTSFLKKEFFLSFMNISLLALFSSLLSNSNLAMTNSLIPYNIFNLFKSGFSFETIGIAYFDKIQSIDSYQGNKIVNIIFFFIAWPKVIYIPYVVYSWDKLKFYKKIIATIIVLIPVFSGISTGTNKPVFDFVLLFISSLGVYFLTNKYLFNTYYFNKRKLFAIISIAGLIFSVYFFSMAMKGRNVDYEFLESTSPLGDIRVHSSVSDSESENAGVVWLTNYIVQGYYGFSLALDQNFTTTFGFGNSPFLSRQFEWLTGIELRKRTYQYKIDPIWGETVQWHSFYSQFANDFHFIGVIFVLFLLGFLMAITWKSILLFNNFYAKLLLPLYFIIFIFMPANNQVFGYIETLSTFLILNYYLFKSIKFNNG